MRWFKHMADMHSDPFCVELMDRFGLEGYGAYVLTLEIYARECGTTPGEILRISRRVLKKKLALSDRKLINLLNFFDQHRKILCDISPELCQLAVPKMRDIADEWTKKQQRHSGVTPAPRRHDPESEESEETLEGHDTSQTAPPDAAGTSVFFTIRRGETTQSESQWLAQQCGNALPGVFRKQRWLKYPVEKRMAAYAYVQLEVDANHQLAYALKILETADFTQCGTPLSDYYRIACHCVRQNDYDVTVETPC